MLEDLHTRRHLYVRVTPCSVSVVPPQAMMLFTQPRASKHVLTLTHTRTSMCSCFHTCTCSHVHTYALCVHIHLHTCSTCSCGHVLVCTITHTHTDKGMPACRHAHTRTSTHAHSHVHMCARKLSLSQEHHAHITPSVPSLHTHPPAPGLSHAPMCPRPCFLGEDSEGMRVRVGGPPPTALSLHRGTRDSPPGTSGTRHTSCHVEALLRPQPRPLAWVGVLRTGPPGPMALSPPEALDSAPCVTG